MSQNLVGVLRSYKDKWYVFPTTAEATVGDTMFIPYDAYNKDGSINWEMTEELPQKEWIRELEIRDSMTLGPYNTKLEAYENAENDFDELTGFDEGFEYGIIEAIELDGVKLVVTFEGDEINE